LREISNQVLTRIRIPSYNCIPNRYFHCSSRSFFWERSDLRDRCKWGRKDNKKGKKVNKKGKDDSEEEFITADDFDLQNVRTMLKKPVDALILNLSKLRADKATPSLLDKLKIDTKNGFVALSSVGQVSVKDAQTLHITLLDDKVAKVVEKAIKDMPDSMLQPSIEGNIIKVRVPKPTKEYRETLVKQANSFTEKAKLNVRDIRKNTMDLVKKTNMPKDDSKRVEKDIQNIIDATVKELSTIFESKSKELMTI